MTVTAFVLGLLILTGLAVAVLALPGGYLAWHAIKGRVLPAEAVVDIAPPFPPGRYLIAHGGSSPLWRAVVDYHQ